MILDGKSLKIAKNDISGKRLEQVVWIYEELTGL